MRIREVELTFENCETVKFPGRYIGEFLVDDIRKTIGRVAVNAIMEQDIAYKFLMEVHKDARKIYTTICTSEPENESFDRIVQYNDITHIDFIIDEGEANDPDEPIGEEKEYHYLVHWEGNSDYFNKAQEAYISTPGHLYITIGQKVEDAFGRLDIENAESTAARFEMYGIGDR